MKNCAKVSLLGSILTKLYELSGVQTLKVLHIIGDSKFGGGDTVILGIAKMAKNLGCQVDVLATDPLTQKIFSEFGIGIIPLDVI